MPTPREIATQVNDGSQFASPEAGFDATEGVPTAAKKGERREQDYRVNPTNPPEPACPCTGMHK